MSYAAITTARKRLQRCAACGLKRALASRREGIDGITCQDERCGEFTPLLRLNEIKPANNYPKQEFPSLTFFTPLTCDSFGRRTANGPEPKRAENAKPHPMNRGADRSLVQTSTWETFRFGRGQPGKVRPAATQANSLRHRRNRLCAATNSTGY